MVSQSATAQPERLLFGNLPFTAEVRRGQWARAVSLSLTTHALSATLVVGVPLLLPEKARPPIPPQPQHHMVWIPVLIPPEESGGGDGESLEFAAEVEPPEELAAQPSVETPPPVPLPPMERALEPEPPELHSPIPVLASTDHEMLFVSVTALPLASHLSAARQVGGETLLEGAGHGPGEGGGSGGGVYRPGAGIRVPVPVREVKARYTADAMLARVEGSILLEVVVLPDGTVGEVRIVRSFDPRSGQDFGLDQAAVTAVRQWQFRPGRRFGQPVAVLVRLTVTFTLR